MENTETVMSDKDDTNVDAAESDSDDDLEEAPAIIRQSHACMLNSSSSSETTKTSPEKGSRLDALLAEHRREKKKDERLKELRDKLSRDIKQGSEEEVTADEATLSLASEHADHIEQLQVKSSELRPVQPGLKVFYEERFCCLFCENISPFNCAFNPSNSCIDKLLAHITPAEIPTVLSSKVLVTCAHQISCIESVMRWLLFMRADPKKLTEAQKVFIGGEMRKYMTPDNDENINKTPEGNLQCLNVGRVLNVISESLQTRPKICHQELSFMLHILAVAALDLTSRESFVYLENDFQVCFSSILECYSSDAWPSVVPDLCRCLSQVTDHHHNLSYLVYLFPIGTRSSYLRVRLSYTFLVKLLTTRDSEISDSELENLQLRDVAELGIPTEQGHVSTLCFKLKQLVQTDLYKASSVIKLLDFSVGEELHRSTQPRDQLEYVLTEVNYVLKGMKDKVSELDVSKVKDRLSQLTGKWSLTIQSKRSVQRSIFVWDTATTHQRVKEEPLQNEESEDSS